MSDLSKIGNNENNISNNLEKINTNKNDINDIIEAQDLINLNSSSNASTILQNSSKINNNKSNIDEIKSNLSNIDFNSNNKYSIENFFIYNIEIENSYKINKDKPNFSIFKYTLEDYLKKSILEIDCRLLYQYTNYNNIGFLKHIFKLYDGTDTTFYDYNILLTSSGYNRSNDLKQNDLFYVKLDDGYEVIKIELILSLIDNVTNTVHCKIYNAYNSNFLCIKHFKKINLISVNNNFGDLKNTILSNSSKINNIKNSIYLKNIYNILFYDSKTQVDFRNLFYEKIFQINAKENDFIEINFKMLLEYEDISEKNYVNAIYEN